jgi:hypothetical protein
MIDISDLARTATNVRNADPRMERQSLDHRLSYIAQFVLSDNVPEKVRIHFETGKNLFVYAWYVYRFHMVAEQHVLGTLEMATRTRLTACISTSPPRGLWRLLGAARDANLIANERLSNRYQWALERAQWRHDVAEMERMTLEGLSECAIDYSSVRPNEEDLQYDWLEQFICTLPKLRNMHAHGSQALYPTVGRTFEIVHELINQLFSDDKHEEK